MKRQGVRRRKSGPVTGAAAKPAWRRRLVVMVKAPQAGRVKTRLAAGIGTVGATAFFRHLIAGTIARLAADRRWETWLAVSPDESVKGTYWPAVDGVLSQGGGDLGRRMQRMIDRNWLGPVIIIGADIPGIRAADIAGALHALGRHDVAIGPATDGGYWLIGARRVPRRPRPFGGVRWSSESTLADTLANLDGFDVGLLRPIMDIDTIDEWRLCRSWSGRRILPMGR